MTQDIQTIGIKTNITAKFYDQRTLFFWQKMVNKIIKKLPRKWMKFYQLGTLKGIDEHKNVICNNGLNAFCKLGTGDTTYSGEINKSLLGTGIGAAAAASDTTLETETYRNDMASGSENSNVMRLTSFFTETECTGTYKEYGNCIDGAAGADTGQLWSHLKGLTWVKDDQTVIVVSCEYSFASV